MGRPKGSTNHQTKAIKDMIRAALDRVGGEDYFVKQAQDCPTAFMTLIGKVMPQEINLGGQKDNPVVTMSDKEILNQYLKGNDNAIEKRH